MSKVYKVHIANVTPKQCGDWLHKACISGATITEGFGYWELLLEPQCTVELSGIAVESLTQFIREVFRHTDERAVFVVCHEAHYTQEVYRGPYDLLPK